MAGNKQGGKAAATTNKLLYGDDFYKVQGAKGGKTSTGGGFAKMSPERLREVSRIGGINKWRKQRKEQNGD